MQLHKSLLRTYDHRIREHICRTRNPNFFPELRIPRSTTTSWLRRPLPIVVSCQRQIEDVAVLREQVDKLETRVRRLAAVLHLQMALLRVSGFSLERNRLPDGAVKKSVLRAVTRAKSALPLAGILRILLCWLRVSSNSSRKSVVVVEPAEYWKRENPTMRSEWMRHAGRDLLPDTLMRARMVDVVHVLREHSMEVSFTENQQVIKALAPHASHKPFTQSVRSGCLHRRVQNSDSSSVRNPIEHGSELVVVVPDQETRSLAPRCSIPQLLYHPGGGR